MVIKQLFLLWSRSACSSLCFTGKEFQKHCFNGDAWIKEIFKNKTKSSKTFACRCDWTFPKLVELTILKMYNNARCCSQLLLTIQKNVNLNTSWQYDALLQLLCLLQSSSWEIVTGRHLSLYLVFQKSVKDKFFTRLVRVFCWKYNFLDNQSSIQLDSLLNKSIFSEKGMTTPQPPTNILQIS